jgi:hypothetical protein
MLQPHSRVPELQALVGDRAVVLCKHLPPLQTLVVKGTLQIGRYIAAGVHVVLYTAFSVCSPHSMTTSAFGEQWLGYNS